MLAVTRLSLFCALLLAAPFARAGELQIPVERYHLGNGLTVILHEDHRLPQVAVNVWFRVGSKDEREKRTGFAHLFEHLMFMGTTDVPNGSFDTIMEAEGGANNASTSEDRTNYFELGPKGLLETFLYLEADRLRTLPEAMTKQKVDLQRDVVKNERRQSYENRPYGQVDLVLVDKLYPKGHPYQHPVIGSHADLTAASVEDVKAFFRGFYVPSNASLVVAGDFKPDEAKQLIERYFGSMPRVPEPAHRVPPPVELVKSEHVTVRDAVQLEQVTLAWHSPALLGPGDAQADLLAALLGAGKSSRLERALVYDQKLAQEVRVQHSALRYDGVFTITATALEGHTAAELEKAIEVELQKLRDTAPPTVREVESARAFTEMHTLHDLGSLALLADGLNEYEFVRGDPGELARNALQRYQSVGPADLAWQAHAIFDKPHLTVIVLPKAPPRTAGTTKGAARAQ